MDEYFIVPKRMMENRAAAQIQFNKEPPEAVEVLSLDNLTNRILKRKDISDWEKASQLTSTLERFLALKPKAFGETVISPSAQTHAVEPEPPQKKPRKSRSVEKDRKRSRNPHRPDPSVDTFHTPAAPSKTRSGKRFQFGTGKRKWIML